MRARRVVPLLVLLVLAWGAGVTWLLSSSALAMQEGRRAATEGRAALLERDLEAGAPPLADAAEHFGRARRRLSSPLLWPLDRIVPVWANLESARAMAQAGHAMAAGSSEAIMAVERLPEGLASLTPRGGQLPIDALAAIQPALAAAEAQLAQARSAFERAPREGLLGPVVSARAETDEALSQAEALLGPAAAAAAALPPFLGADGPRRYFFVAQNPAELRGTGGFMGSFSILEVDRGRLRFSPFREIWDLPTGDLSAIEPPTAGYARRYRRTGGWAFWPNINFTPDFPSAAVAMERLYGAVEGEPLDGVIATDPRALEALLSLTGPIDVPEVGRVSPSDVVEVVTTTAYAEFDDHAERKEVLGGVAAAAFSRLLEGGLEQGDQLGAVQLLAGIASHGHLKVHAVDEREQAAFAALGMAGAVPPPYDDVVGVTVNNRAQNKADAFMRRTVEYEATLDPSGAIRSTVHVGFANATPTQGLPSHVIGGAFPGRNQFLLDVFCGGDCELRDVERLLPGAEPLVESELGYTVFATTARLASGEEERVSVSWEEEEGWQPDGAGGGRYRLTLFDQPTVIPTRASARIALPEGARVVAADDGLQQEGSTLRWEGELSAPRSFEVRLAGSEPEAVPDPPLGQRVRAWLSTPLLRWG